MNEQKSKRFFWGLLLAWSPWVPCVVGLGFAFRSILSEKATGLAVVAGGFTEMFVTWGIFSLLVAQVTAIVMLSRCVSGGWVRGLVSILSISASCIMLLLLGLFLWLTWFQRHPAP